jgi:glyoxylase-like metal-dependent hydrolase (beta-lactamase superfamily II)
MPAYEEIFPFIYHVPLGYVHAYLIAEEDGLTLIDSGMKGNDKKILRAISELGRKPEDLKTILITHHHSDHVGSLAALVKRSGATAWVHPLDARIVAGEQKRPSPNRASIAGRILGPLISRLPQNNPPPAKAGHQVTDGETVPVAGGVQAIHTPGHTAGHMSYLAPGHGSVLFAGDAAAHGFGRLGKPLLIFTEDMDEVKRSIRKLAALEFETACFGHGGVVKGEAHLEFKRYIERMAK